MQKIRDIFFALMALLGLSLLVANWQRSHAYETGVLVPLRQALVLTTDKAAPLVSRAALFAEAYGMTDKENPTCSPYEVSCAESLVDIASDVSHSRLKTGSMPQGQRSRLISPSDKAKAFELR